jgi:menaquinone-dependent protoporphyrinogen oxidase
VGTQRPVRSGLVIFNESPETVANILLLHSSVYGHTVKISEFMHDELRSRGDHVEVRPLAQGATGATLFDAIVIGSSIRYGKHHAEVLDFVRKHADLFRFMPSAFFSVSLVARKANRATPETNQYVKKFFTQTAWQPRLVAVFAGKLDYPRYRWSDRQMIRFIMWLTKGPTDPSATVEFTDWTKVREFANAVSQIARRAQAASR